MEWMNFIPGYQIDCKGNLKNKDTGNIVRADKWGLDDGIAPAQVSEIYQDKSIYVDWMEIKDNKRSISDALRTIHRNEEGTSGIFKGHSAIFSKAAVLLIDSTTCGHKILMLRTDGAAFAYISWPYLTDELLIKEKITAIMNNSSNIS